MKTFEDWVKKADDAARRGDVGGAVGYCVNALFTLAEERAEARRGQIRIDNPTIGMIAPPIDGLSPERTARLYEEHREAVNALMAERAAAMNRLAQNDADELAGEPRSYSHWGMHA